MLRCILCGAQFGEFNFRQRWGKAMGKSVVNMVNYCFGGRGEITTRVLIITARTCEQTKFKPNSYSHHTEPNTLLFESSSKSHWYVSLLKALILVQNKVKYSLNFDSFK